jgi:ribose transport system permease protein
MLAVERLGQLGLPLLLIAVLVGFSVVKPSTFGQWQNFKITLEQQIPVLVAALAVMLTLTVGEFDLSIASNLSLANTLVVGLCVKQHWSVVVAILVALAASTAIGLANGIIVTKFQIPAFVATLGTGTIAGGIGLAYSHQEDFFAAPKSLTDIGRTDLFGQIPITVLYGIVIAGVLYVVLRWLPIGRKMRAVGENRRAAQLSGLSPTRQIMATFTTAGFLAGVGGVILGSQTGGSAVASSGALLLPAFAAAFLGATTIEPGRFNVLGTIIAVYFLAFTVTGLQLVGAEGWVQPVVDGLALLIAVGLSTWALRLRSARLRSEQLQAVEEAATSPADQREQDAAGVAD